MCQNLKMHGLVLVYLWDEAWSTKDECLKGPGPQAKNLRSPWQQVGAKRQHGVRGVDAMRWVRKKTKDVCVSVSRISVNSHFEVRLWQKRHQAIIAKLV